MSTSTLTLPYLTMNMQHLDLSQQGSQNSGLEVGNYSTTKFRMWWSIGESSSDAPEAAAFAIGG